MARTQGLDFKYRVSGSSAVTNSLKAIQDRIASVSSGIGGIAAASRGAAAGIGSIGARAASTVAKVGAATAAVGALFVASRAGQFSQDIIDADVGLSQLRISLEQASGSAGAADREIEFLRKTARRFGVEIAQVAQPYAQFANAITASGGSLDLARNAFLGVTQAGLGLGATSEQISRVLRQLQQAASKNKITMEDLGTVAESLPGALGLLAQSLGITTKELAELTASGSLEAIPALEKFGTFLQNRFASAADKAAKDVQSSQARFRNAFLETRQKIASGGFADALQSAFDRVTAAVERFNDSGGAEGFGAFLARGLNRATDAAFNLFGRISELAKNEKVLRALAIAGQIIRISFESLGNVVRIFFAGFTQGRSSGSVIESILFGILKLNIAFNQISKSSFFNTLGRFAASILSSVVKGFNALFASARRIFTALQTGGSTFNVYEDLIVSILRVFRQMIPLIGTAFGAIFSGVQSGSGAISGFVRLLSDALNQLALIFQTFNGRNAGLGDNFIAPGLSDRAKLIVDFISQALDIGKAVGPVLVAALNGAFDVAKQFAPVLQAAFIQVGTIIRDTFGQIDIKSVLADIALLFQGANADQAANASLEPLFQIRDVVKQAIEALAGALPVVIAIAGTLLQGFIAVFDILNNKVRPVLDTVVQALGFDSFIALVAQIKVATILLNGVAATGSAIAGTFGTIGKSVAFVLAIFRRLKILVFLVKSVFFVISTAIGVSAGTLLAIVGVVVAIGAAVFLIYKYWDEILAFLKQIGSFLLDIGAAILTGIGNAIKAIPGLFIAAFNAVLQFMVNWSLPALLLRLLEAVFPGITEGLKNAFLSGIEAIKGFFNELWLFVKDIFFGNFSSAWNRLKSFFGFSGDAQPPANDNLPAFAKGGSVFGKGSGKSDSILAWLSNGEYVINAAAARAFRPLLDMINYGGSSFRSKMKNGLPAFANGGLVGMPQINMPQINMNGGIDLSNLRQVHGWIDGQKYLPDVPLFTDVPEKVVQEGFRKMSRTRVRRGNVKG